MALSIATPARPSPQTSASPPPPPLSASGPSPSSSSSAVRSPSPQPPPASPLTPPAQPAKLAVHTQPAQFIQQPPSLPFSSHDSSDAIALRAAISSLQFQRLQAQRDLRTLEDIKCQAVERPEEYRQHVIATAHTKPSPPPWATSDASHQQTDHEDDADDDDAAAVLGADSEHEPVPLNSGSPRKSSSISHGSMLQSQSQKTKGPHQAFGFPAVPLPQDVVRCPPIEWAKYHIVGESLDKLHRHQQARPGDTDIPQRDSLVAAPYNPFLDKLDQQPTPESNGTTASRKDSGSSASDQHAQARPSKPAM